MHLVKGHHLCAFSLVAFVPKHLNQSDNLPFISCMQRILRLELKPHVQTNDTAILPTS